MRKTLYAGCVLAVCASAFSQDMIRKEGPIEATVTSVTAVSPSPHGSRKQPGLYRVELSSVTASYVAYCLHRWPESGRTYQVLDEYVSENYSSLQLWPVNRKDIEGSTQKKGQLYRVIIFQEALAGEHPDLACDLRSETGKK